MTRPMALPPRSAVKGTRPMLERVGVVGLVASSVALVAAIVGLSVSYTSMAAIAVVAICAAVVAPRTAFGFSLAWILLIRPGYELVHMNLGGIEISEIDLLPLVATVAALAVRSSGETGLRGPRFGSIALILAYPAWLLLRFLILPTVSPIQVSPVVDYRNISMFSVIIPLLLFIQKLGFDSLFRLLMRVAYLACFIAIGAWALLMLGVLKPANTAFVYFHTASDVRPGGELLVVVLAVTLLVGNAPLIARSRALSFAVVAAEFLVSQTLSMVVAVVAGVIFHAVFHRDGRTTKRVLSAIIVVGVFAGLAVGGVAAGSRFDLGERLGESSAQYRATEFSKLIAVVESSPLTLVAGAGAGSAIAVPNVYTSAIDVKRDTHNSYGNVTLKGGLVALILFVMPVIWSMFRLRGSARTGASALSASLSAILVLTITVPFVWTAPGLTALVALLLGSLSAVGPLERLRLETGQRVSEPERRPGERLEPSEGPSKGAHRVGHTSVGLGRSL